MGILTEETTDTAETASTVAGVEEAILPDRAGLNVAVTQFSVDRLERVERSDYGAENSAHRPSESRDGWFLRYSAWDNLFIVLAIVHGAVLLAFPVLPVVALGLWWNSNTISHNFVHRPFFRFRALNTAFSIYLSLLLGVPQSIWKARHLAHHADVPCRLRVGRLLVAEVMLVGCLWLALVVLEPGWFATVYLPGYVLGLVLCQLHGYFEHAAGTTSHYGRPYNWLFFNDGYHVEHHASPGMHWRALPRRVVQHAHSSRWPAVFRFIDYVSLDSLERIVLRSPRLQRFVLRRHERAFHRLLPQGLSRIAIVGGGLFPRTAMILRRLCPDTRIVVIDASADNLRVAQRDLPESIECVHGFYDPVVHSGFDMVVIPLAYVGDRTVLYREPTAPVVLIHDWIWRPRGQSAIVSWCLLKRLNLIRRSPGPEEKLAELSLRLCRY
jgi:hypothetical protein